MNFWEALLTEGLQFVIMLLVAFFAVCLGIAVRKHKNKSIEDEK